MCIYEYVHLLLMIDSFPSLSSVNIIRWMYVDKNSFSPESISCSQKILILPPLFIPRIYWVVCAKKIAFLIIYVSRFLDILSTQVKRRFSTINYPVRTGFFIPFPKEKQYFLNTPSVHFGNNVMYMGLRAVILA